MTAYKLVEGVKVTFSYLRHELLICKAYHHATFTE